MYLNAKISMVRYLEKEPTLKKKMWKWASGLQLYCFCEVVGVLPEILQTTMTP